LRIGSSDEFGFGQMEVGTQPYPYPYPLIRRTWTGNKPALRTFILR
jgi:hypothetical protein